MVNNPPFEVLAHQFLIKQYAKEIDSEEMISISVYASFCFVHIDCFKSWWYISNIGLSGNSPATLATQESGLKKISHYLISMAYQIEDWAD